MANSRGRIVNVYSQSKEYRPKIASEGSFSTRWKKIHIHPRTDAVDTSTVIEGKSSVQSGGPMQATDGNIYGTTAYGRLYADGTEFSLSVGLAPFVASRLPSSSSVRLMF